MTLKFLFFIISSLICCVFTQETADHYPNKVEIDRNSGYGFSVEYFPNYKVLTNIITSEKYALVCCNQALDNFTGYHAVVNTPLTNVAVDTKLDVLSFFELLGVSTSIKSAQPSANITSPCFEGVSDGPNSSTTAIEAVFTSQFTNAGIGKPQYISVSASNDTLTPVQQSAWVIYIGYFFDLERLGLDIFSSIQKKYECHKTNLANSGSKNIAWTTYDVVGKAWTLRYDAYTQTLIQNAGMKLIGSRDNKTTVYSNLTQFHDALKGVDYIIDDSAVANFNGEVSYGKWLTASGLNPNSNTYSFLTGQNVWRTDRLISKSGFSDWPIRHAARADLAIADVVHMVYSTYEPDYTMTWLRAFAQMGDSKFISNASYPSCTNPAERIELDICSLNPFNPNHEVDRTPQPSTNPQISSGLSTGGKVGVSVGIVVGLAAFAVLGTFIYRRRSVKNKEGAFYKMNDM